MKPYWACGFTALVVCLEDQTIASHAALADYLGKELPGANISYVPSFVQVEASGDVNHVAAIRKRLRRLSRGKPRFRIEDYNVYSYPTATYTTR